MLTSNGIFGDLEEEQQIRRVSRAYLEGLKGNSSLEEVCFHCGLSKEDKMRFSSALERLCFRNSVSKFLPNNVTHRRPKAFASSCSFCNKDDAISMRTARKYAVGINERFHPLCYD